MHAGFPGTTYIQTHQPRPLARRINMALQRPAIALAFLLAWTHWSAVSGISELFNTCCTEILHVHSISFVIDVRYSTPPPTVICPSPDYRLGPNGDSCYLYHHTLTVYSAANRTCVRAGSTMIIIQTQEENEWVYQNLFEGPGNEEEFWLGMHDQDTEGTFRYVTALVTAWFIFTPHTRPAGGSTEVFLCTRTEPQPSLTTTPILWTVSSSPVVAGPSTPRAVA